MSKTYDKYIAPIMTNMDSNTQKHLLYRFSAIYRLNPQSMFRMKSKATKETIIRSFYWCAAQLYSVKNEPEICVVANAGQAEIVEKLKKQVSSLPVDSVDVLLDAFIKLAENSKVYSFFETPDLPKQTFYKPVHGIGRILHRQH